MAIETPSFLAAAPIGRGFMVFESRIYPNWIYLSMYIFALEVNGRLLLTNEDWN